MSDRPPSMRSARSPVSLVRMRLQARAAHWQSVPLAKPRVGHTFPQRPPDHARKAQGLPAMHSETPEVGMSSEHAFLESPMLKGRP